MASQTQYAIHIIHSPMFSVSYLYKPIVIRVVDRIIHQNYKDSILKAKDIDTKVTGRTTGHPVRCLRNQMTKEYLRLEAEGATLEELENLSLGGLKKAVVDGDTQNGSLMAGQSAGLVKAECTCKELIEKIVTEAESLMEGR